MGKMGNSWRGMEKITKTGETDQGVTRSDTSVASCLATVISPTHTPDSVQQLNAFMRSETSDPGFSVWNHDTATWMSLQRRSLQ